MESATLERTRSVYWNAAKPGRVSFRDSKKSHDFEERARFAESGDVSGLAHPILAFALAALLPCCTTAADDETQASSSGTPAPLNPAPSAPSSDSGAEPVVLPGTGGPTPGGTVTGTEVVAQDTLAGINFFVSEDLSRIAVRRNSDILPMLPAGVSTAGPEYDFSPNELRLSTVAEFYVPAELPDEGLVLLRRDGGSDESYEAVTSTIYVQGSNPLQIVFGTTKFGMYRAAKASDEALFYQSRVHNEINGCAGCHGSGGGAPQFLAEPNARERLLAWRPRSAGAPTSLVNPANPDQSFLLTYAQSMNHPVSPDATQHKVIRDWISLL